ncbi:MAG TPA: ComEC/Rec2 family competence protein [Thermoleophilaceae bacterium]|nr:ComEC/Rec2 family competence protein [Thermoleophilaceae bacterium]
MSRAGLASTGADARRPRTASLGRLVPLATLVALTVVVGQARLERIDAPGERLVDGQPIAGVAQLSEPLRQGPFGASAEVELVDGPERGSRLLARLPRGVGIPADAGPGVELELSGSFERPRAGGGGFDLAGRLRNRGIAGELAVVRARVTGNRRGGLSGAIDGVRERALAGIAAELAPPRGALAQGMVLGADDDVPDAVREDFRDAGLSHVLAASGQNVMLLVALAIPLLAAVGLSYSARVAVLIGLIALYVPLAGGGPSIVRAGVMGAAGLLAILLSRPASRWYALFLAACVTLALNPRVWAEPGWQLSFAAVVGILLLAPGIGRRLSALPTPLADGIALTTAATLATAPLVAHHFETVSLASLPANVVALPLVAPIMWLGMLRGLLGQAAGAGPLAGVAAAVNGLLGQLLAPLLSGVERLAALFADAPGSTLPVALGGPYEVVLAYAVLGAAVLATRRLSNRVDTRASTAVAYLRRLPRRRRLSLAVAAIAVVALALARGLAPAGPPATLTVTFLDVGQGDATLVQHPDGSAVLFDGGPPEGGVARLLRRAGVRRLSAVVMTHASRDHHGGLAEVVERFPVDVLLDGGDGTRDRDFRTVVAAARARGVRRVAAVAPLALRAGSLRIDVLSPSPRAPGPPPEDPNPRAVVAVVSSDGFDLLLSGDAESETLLPLALPDVEALKLPHHGSSDPGLPEVLDQVRPEVASIPVGANSYGHPAPSTLAALRAARVPTWRNDRHGSVRLSIDHGALTVEPEHGGAVELDR